ncbi:MAG: UDP-glucose 4-epimerase, partial [Acinetobacter sp.]
IIRDTALTDSEWKIAILRLGNIAGAFEHAVLGEFVAPLPKNIIPLALQVAARQREYLELRQQAHTTDQTVERSFLHVLDCCDAILATLHWLRTQQYVCEAFNIAGQNMSIRTLLNEIAKVTHTEIKTVDAPFYTAAELDQIGASSAKAREILKWQPTRDINQIIGDAWRFYQQILKGH